MTLKDREKHVPALAIAMACGLAADQAWAQMESLPLGYATNFTSVSYYEPPHELQVKLRLSGAEAVPLPDVCYDLKSMKLEKYSVEGKLEAVAEAPQCVFALADGIASSPGHVVFQSGDGKFRVEGDGFTWLQNESSLSISNRVHAVIKTKLFNFTGL
ncbi:MAG TPA: hypothetical protein VF988_10845 [Verrucomicrobiae bacterium]